MAGSAAIDGGLTLDPPTVLPTVCDYNLANLREEQSFIKDMSVEQGVKPGEGQKTTHSTFDKINAEAKSIAAKLELGDRIKVYSDQ